MNWKRSNLQGASRGLFVNRVSSPVGWTALWMVLAGLLQAASLAWPFATPTAFGVFSLTQGQPVWWLQWLAMAALVLGVTGADTPRRAARLGWWFGCTVGCFGGAGTGGCAGTVQRSSYVVI